ncbi:MAG: hypothetical protein Unbinned834contig1000_36 [Prokaryotic dsDNA virus sp.]|nr:MAG: hypothetical protein Unbinned834contig1000_36 [Prokaryotic dsDNA virus sp.]|tara:strand:- start:34877 stop:36400 length:1524 start_codon:yes stop_codon:yes gene_type:complete
MALASYNRSHQRQAYHLYVTPPKRRISKNSWWWQSWIAGIGTSIAPDGVDFASAIGDIALNNPVTAITMTGVDFQSAVGEDGFGIGIRRCKIGHDASSFFVGKNISTNPTSTVRVFRFGSNEDDRTNRVVKFPKVKREYVNVTASPINVRMENASEFFNTIIEDRTQFKQPAMIEYGYQASTYSADVLCIGGGVLTNATYGNHEVSMTLKNRLDILAETKMSIDTTSRQGITYVGSEWNPADMVWNILTTNSLALKFSSIESYTNPQIHYDSWKAWHDTLDSENITVNGYFPFATNYQKALQSVAENTDSAIYVEGDNRLYFRRNLVGVNSYKADLTDSDILRMTAKGNAYDMCNQFSVPMSYAVSGGSLGLPHSTVVFNDTASQNSFGIVQKEPTTKLIWYTNSANANNLAQRIVYRRREPEVELDIETPIKYLNQQLGDLIYVTANEVGLFEQPYTLIGETIDVENHKMNLQLSVGHGLAVANLSVFTLGDNILGRMNNTTGLLA